MSIFTPEQIAAATGCPLGAVRENWPLLCDALAARGIDDRANEMGVAATVAIESASTFAPVREAFWLSEDWRRANLRYYPFYGRGHLQLTWEDNYRAAGQELGEDLVGNPDRALDPDVSARILAWYWATRGVRSKDGSRWYSLPELCREPDWEWVRRVVQGGTAGLDRVLEIVGTLDAMPTEGDPMPTARYTPDFELRLQRQDWTCSIRTTQMLLESIGLAVDIGNLQDSMVDAGVVNAAVGLTDGSGARLAAYVRDAWGIPARNDAVSTFEEVVDLAGRQPLGIGGRGWGSAGHWVAVRRVQGDRIVLANPGGTGPTYGQQSLNRAEFAARAPFSYVTIDVAGASPAVVPPPGDPRDARIAELEAALAGQRDALVAKDVEIAALVADRDRANAVTDGLRTRLGVWHDQYLPTFRDVLAAAERDLVP